MIKKFNTGKQFKFMYFLMILTMTAGLTGCGGVELTSETVNLELGDKLSEDVKDYVTVKNEEAYAEMQLDISGVEQGTPGTYAAAVLYDGKSYDFEVVVADTKAPELVCVDYLITKSGTVLSTDIVKGMSDASLTWVGYMVEKTGELDTVSDTEISKQKAVTGAEVEYVEEDLLDEITFSEEGCYRVVAVATDSYEHSTVVTFNAYVDDTAPVLEQTATEVTVDAATINVDELAFEEKSDKLEAVTELLHALPEFEAMEFVSYSDNLNQDQIIIMEYEQVQFDVSGENPVETLKYTCTAQDVAGNTSEEVTYEVKVTYANLDAKALAKKAGLSTGTASSYDGNRPSKIEGMTQAELDAYMLALAERVLAENQGYPNEFDDFITSDWSNLRYNRETGMMELKGEVATETISGYYDAAIAQEAFNLINAERIANGLAALTWDSDMASYSDRRAQEIVTDFSHNSAGGNWNVGENIATGQSTAQEVVAGWMSSEGHKRNILSTVSTRSSLSCYVKTITYPNGEVARIYYWVQNFTH